MRIIEPRAMRYWTDLMLTLRTRVLPVAGSLMSSKRIGTASLFWIEISAPLSPRMRKRTAE